MTDKLTPAELAESTGKKRASAQAAALARLGVPFAYTGRAVIVDRGVAAAHQLLKDAAKGGIAWGEVR